MFFIDPDSIDLTMTNPILLGNIALNIGTVLYLYVYLPQIIHNRKQQHIARLSLKMHYAFFTGYMLDLMYGVLLDLPWQYKLVSIVGALFVTIQHCQLALYNWKQKSLPLTALHISVLCFALSYVSYFFFCLHAHLSSSTTLVIGYVSRSLFLYYAFPQVIKNYRLKSASAISAQFLYVNLTLSVIDIIASWCLNWGWPNKLASPIMLLAMILLFIQRQLYSPRPLQLASVSACSLR